VDGEDSTGRAGRPTSSQAGARGVKLAPRR
jgi:hypothetical protein